MEAIDVGAIRREVWEHQCSTPQSGYSNRARWVMQYSYISYRLAGSNNDVIRHLEGYGIKICHYRANLLPIG